MRDLLLLAIHLFVPTINSARLPDAMRNVVDSNYLRKPELREYLSKSKANVAVLTDYAAMEAYKGNTLSLYSEEMIKKLITNVLQVAIRLFEDHPQVRNWPDRKALPNTFIFRVALCAYLLAIDWISVGGAKGVKPERIRNDLVDVNFAAFATFFDGLLSNDGKVRRIHLEARTLLDAVFGCHISKA